MRAELQQFNVDTAKLGDAALNEMLDKVSGDRKFVVALADIKNGNALEGKTEPLTPQLAKSDGKKSKK